MTQPRHFTITLPAGMFLLNANQKLHHRVKADYVKALRGAAMRQCSEDATMRAALAAANPGPVLQHAYILGIVHLGSARRFDPGNFYPSFKAAIDGLVDAGVLDDDDHTHLVGPDMRPGPVVRGGQIALHIQELTAQEHAAFQWAGLPARYETTKRPPSLRKARHEPDPSHAPRSRVQR